MNNFHINNFDYDLGGDGSCDVEINGVNHVFTFDEQEDGEGSGLVNISIYDSEGGLFTIDDAYNSSVPSGTPDYDQTVQDVKDQIIDEIRSQYHIED